MISEISEILDRKIYKNHGFQKLNTVFENESTVFSFYPKKISEMSKRRFSETSESANTLIIFGFLPQRISDFSILVVTNYLSYGFQFIILVLYTVPALTVPVFPDPRIYGSQENRFSVSSFSKRFPPLRIRYSLLSFRAPGFSPIRFSGIPIFSF